MCVYDSDCEWLFVCVCEYVRLRVFVCVSLCVWVSVYV